jgi:hypothetical protein
MSGDPSCEDYSIGLKQGKVKLCYNELYQGYRGYQYIYVRYNREAKFNKLTIWDRIVLSILSL